MAENVKYPEHMVFGLDIGTRSIVGSVGYMERNKFNVVAHFVKEHDTRSMIDGQIHDIIKVGESVKKVKNELERQTGRTLNEVCIAAAGRVLKTNTVDVEVNRSDDCAINSEEIYSLDLLGIEKAYENIRRDYPDIEFYCVGYSVVKYYMNGYVINNLEGHKARKIGATVLATFLPNEVVEGLYSAVALADLQVANLTLEPIAAINIAIPEQFRLLNIALVDVGAGTSDISITKDGSIIAYGMIPHAGDEITESILQKCLVDFKTAEKIKISSMKNRGVSFKDIMGISHKMMPDDIREMYADTVDNMAKEIAERIMELNGGKSVSAVFVVGGGGKAYGFTSSLAKYLSLPEERVALRGEEVLGDVNFIVDGVKKDPLLVTPIGICMNFYNQKNNFIFVHINDQRIKLYDNDRLTVVDAAMQIGFPNEALFPRRGRELNFILNGKVKMQRGVLGEAAVITINGKEANINSKIVKNDVIAIKDSTIGADAVLNIEQLPEYKSSITFTVNDIAISCPKFVSVNGKIVTASYSIQNDDKIEILDYYSVSQIMQFMDIDIIGKDIYVNGHKALPEEPVYSGFAVEIKETDYLRDESDYYLSDKKDVVNKETDIYDNNVSKPYETDELSVSKNNIMDEHAANENITNENTVNAASSSNYITNKAITVLVNGQDVILQNKSEYIFVDVLDFYPFDTSNMGGKNLVMKLNDNTADFTDSIKEGDIIELYWEK